MTRDETSATLRRREMADREKVMRGLEACACDMRLMQCENCPYHTDKARCLTTLMRDALALLKEQEEKIESLTEDVEVWKKRYKFMVIECKSSDDPNKEPAIVKCYTIEEVEQGKAVAFPND